MKPLIKTILRALATVAVLPLAGTHVLLSLVASRNRSLESHSQLLALVPGMTGSYLRVAFFRRTLARCDPSATICFGTLFSRVEARIGRNVYIGPRCSIGWADLCEDTLIGPAVQIPSGPVTHGIADLSTSIRNQPGSPRCVKIGRDCWIGGGAIVLADIADQTVVGAGSVVAKPLPARVVAAGSPARVIRPRAAEVEIVPPCQAAIPFL